MSWQQNRGLGERAPGTFTTEYNQSFPIHGDMRRKPNKPKHKWHDPLPFTATTTAASDFKHWNILPAKPFKPPVESAGGQETRDFLSEARACFNPKPVVARKAIRRPAQVRATHKFQADTTNRVDFKHWMSARASTPQAPSNKRVYVKETRDFMSEARMAFNGTRAVPARSMKPKQEKGTSLPFEGVSTHHADFAQWDIKPVEQFRPKNEMKSSRPDETRRFVTEARAQFSGKRGIPAVTMKPKVKPYTNLPFKGQTTSQQDFLPWKDARASTPFKLSSNTDWGAENRDFKSEASAAFNPKTEAKVRKPFKPQQKWSNQKDDRSFTSEARQMFQHNGAITPVRSFKPVNPKYVPRPFIARSTHKDDFTGQSVPVPKNFKPVHNRSAEQDNRDFYTEASSSYRGQRGERRRAIRPQDRQPTKEQVF